MVRILVADDHEVVRQGGEEPPASPAGLGGMR